MANNDTSAPAGYYLRLLEGLDEWPSVVPAAEVAALGRPPDAYGLVEIEGGYYVRTTEEVAGRWDDIWPEVQNLFEKALPRIVKLARLPRLRALARRDLLAELRALGFGEYDAELVCNAAAESYLRRSRAPALRDEGAAAR